MKNHEQLETMLRSSLSERAGDVDTTPALYERVQRQATRGAWLRRGVALAGAVAAVVVAVAVIPPLLPAGPMQPDIAETPDAAEPTEAPSVPAVPNDAAPAPDALPEEGMAYVQVDPDGGASLHLPGHTIDLGEGVTSASLAATRDRVAVVSHGFVRVVTTDDGATGEVLTATPDVEEVAFAPDGEGLAWIEGTTLVIHPDGTSREGQRRLPLEGDVPADLRIEQWFYGSDAQVILASDPDGGVWSIPMDDSDVFNTAPTTDAFVSAEDAIDSVLLPDLRRIDLVRDPEQGLMISEDGDLRSIPTGGPFSEELELAANGDGTVVVHDGTTGTGHLIPTVDGALGMEARSWQAPSILAAVPLTAPPTDAETTLLDELGLQPLPLLGTRGTDLLVVDAVSGSETVIPVYAGETEATLGLLDVRPGSTAGEAIIAYENFSEGETSIRFLALRDGEVQLLNGLVVTAPLTGLVWSPDAMHLLWTTEAGTVGVADVTTADGTIRTSSLDELAGEGMVATDWTWDTADPSGDADGQLWFSTGQGAEGATELVTVTRSAGNGLEVDADERQVLRGVAASPTDGRSATVSLQDFEGQLELLLTFDDDRVQYLPLPAFLEDTPGTWPDLAMEAVGGSVVVWTDTGSSFEVRLTGQGEVRNLPDATAWTPIG